MQIQHSAQHRYSLHAVFTGLALVLAATGCSDHFDLGELVNELEQPPLADGELTEPPPPAEPTGSTELDGTVLFAGTADVDVVIEDAAIDYESGTGYPPVAVGDVDGDGFGDWIQGTTLYYGAARPAGSTLSVGGRVVLNDANAEQCRSFFNFEPAGDVNDDGYADIFYNVTDCIIWWQNPDPSAPTPAIPSYLLLGGPERGTGTLELSTDAIPFGDRDQLVGRLADEIAQNPLDATARQGTSLRSLGDLDGDGITDFSVSTRVELYVPVYTVDEEFGGLVSSGGEYTRETVSYVYYGSQSLSASSEPSARLDAVANWQDVGDVDGDGARDTLLTTPESYYIWRGGTARLSGELSLAEGAARIEGEATYYDQLDLPVPTLGDLDGDGHDDLAITQIEPIGDTYQWPVYLFYGRAGLLAQPITTADSAATFDVNSSGTLTALGDWDGDGNSDLLLDHLIMPEGANPELGDQPAAREAMLIRGEAQRFSGSYTVAKERDGLTPPADPSNASTRYSTLPAGDLDGDGFDDLFVWAFYDDLSAPTFGMAIEYGSPVNRSSIR